MTDAINDKILALTINGEVLKSLNLITDYNIDFSTQNYSIAEDGVIEYDLTINFKAIPKRSIEKITTIITIN